MDSVRQNKFARLIQKELGELLQREGSDFYGKAFVTVTTVKTSPDLGHVKVYLSIMGSPKREEIVDALNKETKEVRHRLGKRVKEQIRHIPTLQFFLDDTFDYVEKMEVLFKNIDEPPAYPGGPKTPGKK